MPNPLLPHLEPIGADVRDENMKPGLKLGWPFIAVTLCLSAAASGAIAVPVGAFALIVAAFCGSLELARQFAVIVVLGMAAYGLFGELYRYSLDRWRASNGLEPYQWE